MCVNRAGSKWLNTWLLATSCSQQHKWNARFVCEPNLCARRSASPSHPISENTEHDITLYVRAYGLIHYPVNFLHCLLHWEEEEERAGERESAKSNVRTSIQLVAAVSIGRLLSSFSSPSFYYLYLSVLTQLSSTLTLWALFSFLIVSYIILCSNYIYISLSDRTERPSFTIRSNTHQATRSLPVYEETLPPVSKKARASSCMTSIERLAPEGESMWYQGHGPLLCCFFDVCEELEMLRRLESSKMIWSRDEQNAFVFLAVKVLVRQTRVHAKYAKFLCVCYRLVLCTE